MKSKNETFASLFDSLAYRYDLRPVFDDFLTISLCAFSRDYATGLSSDEELYMATIAKYDKDVVRDVFPKMLTLLIVEMDDRVDSPKGNDVLGEFYELNFCRKNSGQFFTPWDICELMASCALQKPAVKDAPLRIIDPACGSGRTLLASAKHFGRQEHFFGIDIDHTCVKMTVLNLFLNGVFNAEVMWADTLRPNDFNMSYVTSLLPFGIYRIHEKERSQLWRANNAAFRKADTATENEEIQSFRDSARTGSGSQLHLF